MKPFIWFITIAFVLSTAIVGLTSFKSMHDRVNTYAFKLNGDKISKIQVERNKAKLNQNYSQILGKFLDRDTIEMMAFDDVVDRKIILKIAKELHVKVSSSEINARFEAIENSIGNKEQFKRMLSAQGFTKKTFKDEIEENLLIEKTFEKISESINPTAAELKDYYNENKYTLYQGKTFEEVSTDVKKAVVGEKTREEYATLLAAKRKTMEITDVASEYTKLLPNVVMEKDGFKVTNHDIAKRVMIMTMYSKDKELAEKEANVYYEKQLEKLSKAKENGIEINPDLAIDSQIAQYQKEMYKKIFASIEPTEEQLKEYFKPNSIKYDTLASAKVDMAVFYLKPSDEDKKVAKEKAENLIKEITPENFAEKAKKYSQGPSASNGGELGWFGKGAMVAEFDKAVFEGEVGKIYPTPVETVFGYHIISIEGKDEKAEKAKASHILIVPEISEKTLNAKLEDINQLKTKLANGEVKFEDVQKNRTDVVTSGIVDVNEAGYISGLGYNEELAKDIFAAPLDKVEVMEMKNNEDYVFYVFKKVAETKYSKATFDEVKDQVLVDYKNYITQKEMEEIIK